MDIGSVTHLGLVRAMNEDGLFVSDALAVFAVADGMGGHERGEIASGLTVETIGAQADAIAHAAPTDLPAVLHDAIQQANARVLAEQPAAAGAERPMGTTLVLAAINGDRLYFAHIGDSRLYLLRGDVFTQLTRDHSLVQLMVDRGEITPEEAAIHPLRHQITRVVGAGDPVSPEIASQALLPGDHLLLCTDGLSGVVPPEAIKATLASTQSAQEKADALAQAALEAGGPDNITAIVIAYQRPRPAETAQPCQRMKLPHWQTLVISLLSLAILSASVALWLFMHPSYFVKVDTHGSLDLFQRWPLLPMLEAQRAPSVNAPILTLEEVRPHLPEVATVEAGMPVKSKEAGEYFLLGLAEKVAVRLLSEAKTAIDTRSLDRAQSCLTRA
ncbi:MAG TPA: Stp1/IreP family PP2C-type Ser/Thr phosphatase, partial [Armatimonadota bacterium]|nr:Stp1/IreP family PP2C-type Ser/Thr phosphatase [Armatimonadota bacterium]